MRPTSELVTEEMRSRLERVELAVRIDDGDDGGEDEDEGEEFFETHSILEDVV